MSLSEKIMTQRKNKGWSQEDLADRLGISRQSVSKWESGSSSPDLDKIVRMSHIFGVTTDYLLTDNETQAAAACLSVKTVTVNDTETYLEHVKKAAKPMASAIAALVASPTPLILLSGISSRIPYTLSDEMAAGFGTAILLLIIAAAVAVLIGIGIRLNPYEYLEKESFQLQSGAVPMVQRLQENFSGSFRSSISAGVVLCIVGVIPMLIATAFQAGDLVYVVCVDLMLLLIAAGVWLFVWAGVIHGSHQKLLQEGDYTPEAKEISKRTSPLAACYWLVMTSIYLTISFLTMRWDRTWIIWPCAGVRFAAFMAAAEHKFKKDV